MASDVRCRHLPQPPALWIQANSGNSKLAHQMGRNGTTARLGPVLLTDCHPNFDRTSYYCGIASSARKAIPPSPVARSCNSANRQRDRCHCRAFSQELMAASSESRGLVLGPQVIIGCGGACTQGLPVVSMKRCMYTTTCVLSEEASPRRMRKDPVRAGMTLCV